MNDNRPIEDMECQEDNGLLEDGEVVPESDEDVLSDMDNDDYNYKPQYSHRGNRQRVSLIYPT